VALELDFTGRTILVCGIHKGGMGGATCRLIARGGGTVIALDRDPAYAEDIAAELRATGATVHTMVADLSDIAACERVIPEALRRFGPIDGIANIAGGTRGEEWMPLEDTPGDSFWKTLQLNFAYVFYLCRDLAKFWIEEGRTGAIVNIGSVSAKDAAPWHGPYGAAKSGIIALTRTMANEWGELGIRANSVSPGAVMSERVMTKTGMSQAAIDSRDPAVSVIFSEPGELAGAITFLLSDLASGISGQNIAVDRALSTRFCAGGRRTRKDMAAIAEARTAEKVGAD
jgi:NAD(P)-dependent dehydrogenase (short-subunit alcohol dehydrogenase family)